MTDQTNDIQPASFNAEATAKMLGLSDLQLKWCLATLRGANQTAAARTAGYEGTAEQLRSAGHRVAKSGKVQKFLELAALEGGGLTDQPMDAAEQKRILSKTARGSDKSAAIRAIEVNHRIAESERTIAGQEASAEPTDTLNEIAEISPEFALHLANKNNIAWTPLLT